MFAIVGTRKNGHSINKSYDDERVARFEFDITSTVATDLVLYKGDIVIDEYHLEVKKEIQYKLQGQTAFNELDIMFDTIEDANKAFESEKDRCDWIVLYEVKDDSMEQLEIYVKQGVA